METSSFTAAQAQQRIHQNLAASLDTLPGHLHLSKVPQNPALATFGAERPLLNPCWEGNIQSTGPRYLSTSYWVIGVPAGEIQQYYDSILSAWENHGWTVERIAPWSAQAELPDGFGLSVLNADGGALSVDGMSPCVDESTIADLTNEPETIGNP